MAIGDHWPSSAANSNRPRPDIVRLTENCLLLMRLSATSGISWKASNSHCLLITNLSRFPLVRSRMPGPHDSSVSSQRYRNSLLTSDTWQARTMWLQMLFPGLPFRPLVGASVSRPRLPPNSQTQSVWLPARTAITGLQLKDIPFGPNNTTLLCDVSLGRPRPLVPVSFRRRIFDTLHGLSHPGIWATRKLVARKYVWHGLGRQVGEWAKTCIACQRAKVNLHHCAPLSEYNEPVLRFDHVNVDLVGPLHLSKGFAHLLTVVDRVTRWPEAIPLASISNKDMADSFLSGWITRYGLPSDVSSDRGPQFTLQLWQDLSNPLGTKLHRTTAYHPQANGLVERFHRSMKASLKACCQSPSRTPDLHWVMLGLRTMPKEDLGTSPAELLSLGNL